MICKEDKAPRTNIFRFEKVRSFNRIHFSPKISLYFFPRTYWIYLSLPRPITLLLILQYSPHPALASPSKESVSKFCRNIQKVILLAKKIKTVEHSFFFAELNHSPGLDNHRGAITQSYLATEI